MIRMLTGLVLGLLGVALVWTLLPPTNFPTGQVVTIAPGNDLGAISRQLQKADVVRSAFWLRGLIRMTKGETGVQAGHYFFEQPLNLIGVVWRLSHGKFVRQPLKVTIPEGLTAKDTGKLLARALPDFDQSGFVVLADPFAGQLFPDTYFFPPTVSEEQVLELMRGNFDDQIKSLQNQINGSGWSLEQMLVMASLVEKEAWDPTDRRLIAGILWKRYEAGMALQVDVARETYNQVGLPPKPIVNPSLDAILATLYPTESPYWFYLADKRGVTRFSKNYKDHLANIKKYL